MNHFQFHYNHTLRFLLVDKFRSLEISSLETFSFSTSSASFLKDQNSLLTSKLGFEMIGGSSMTWTQIRHPLSNFGTKKGQVIGFKGDFHKKWDSLDFSLFLSLPLSKRRGHFGKTREFHSGVSKIEGFYPFSFFCRDWNLHLNFSFPSPFLFSSFYLNDTVNNL